MFIPRHNREHDLAVLHEIIERYDFGLLVVRDDSGGLEAVHLPFLLDSDRGPQGTLLAHLARANPAAASIERGGELLVVFQGPHGYISPDWYQDRATVPTWNYVAVHAYGQPRVVADPERLLTMLQRLVDRHERARPTPWSLDAAPGGVAVRLLAGIVAFEIEITRLDGKVKLSQNKSAADRTGTIAGLRAEVGAAGAALVEWMERYLDR